MSPEPERTYKLAIINTHPVQYFAPLYRYLASDPRIDLTVHYCTDIGARAYFDQEFGHEVKWDVPLLAGYRACVHQPLRKVNESGALKSLFNPSLLKAIYTDPYDAVLIQGYNNPSLFLSYCISKMSRKRLLIRGETHLLLRRSFLRFFLRGIFLKATLFKWCDGFLAIGRANSEFYQFHGVPGSRVYSVPYVVDNEFFRQAAEAYRPRRTQLRTDHGLKGDSVVFVVVGKLQSRKRPFNVLHAFQALSSSSSYLGANRTAELVYVGTGTDEHDLREYAVTHQLGRVHFLGFQNQNELPACLAVADCLILASEEEPWGLVINEAMASGLTVIASEDIGACRDLVVQNVTGLSFKPGDVRGLQDCMERLTLDVLLLQRLKNGAVSRIAEWGFPEAKDGILSALARVCR